MEAKGLGMKDELRKTGGESQLGTGEKADGDTRRKKGCLLRRLNWGSLGESCTVEQLHTTPPLAVLHLLGKPPHSKHIFTMQAYNVLYG